MILLLLILKKIFRPQLFQRRINGSVNFRRDWFDYENGFGSRESEFWLGTINRNIQFRNVMEVFAFTDYPQGHNNIPNQSENDKDDKYF